MTIKKLLIKIVSLGMMLTMIMTTISCSEKKTPPKKPDTTQKQLSYSESMLISRFRTETTLRDPSVLLHDGKYYMYGTGWKYCVSSDLDKTFSVPQSCVEKPEDYEGDPWAPEVYKYGKKFYMFTTYRSSENGHRGCAIFVADDPAGPFKLHSDGHITPDDWDAIDGTLYIDNDGQPWMVFVHEWTSTDDSIGRMACAKLSKDLKEFISEPVELFRADDPAWARDGAQVTDGCFMYQTEKGDLLMIWSNADKYGYCVGVARSESGSILGPWTHDEKTLYSKEYTEEYDGGHGMIFQDKNGYLWMSIHSPNSASAGRVETPVFIPLYEEDGSLVWDIYKRDYIYDRRK